MRLLLALSFLSLLSQEWHYLLEHRHHIIQTSVRQGLNFSNTGFGNEEFLLSNRFV